MLAANQAWAIDVASQNDWNTAVAAVAAAGTGSTVSINFTAGFTLTSSLAQLQVSNTGVIVNITGNGQTVNGASTFQGIQIVGTNAPTVNISSLAITNTTAIGGVGQNGQNGFFSSGLSYGSGGGGGGGGGAGGGLLVGGGANVTLAAVTFTGNTATGGTGGNGGSGQGGAASATGGNGGDGGAANNGGASGGGGAGGNGGNNNSGNGTVSTPGAAGTAFGAGGGGGGGSGTTNSTSYTANNPGGAGNTQSGTPVGGAGATGGDGVTNHPGAGSDGGAGGGGGAAQGGAIYVATGASLTILDTPISGAAATGGAGGTGGTGQGTGGPNGSGSINGGNGTAGTGAGAGIFLSGVMVNIGVSTGSVTYANTIGGTGVLAGAINKTGAGMLTLSATNTFTGNVNIVGGTLAIVGTGNLGNTANGVAMSDGTTLAVTGTTTLASGRAFKIAGASTLDIASGTITTLQGVISDGASAGSLVKSSAGTLVLSGANTYTGSTTVNGGTLRAGSANALPSGSAFTVAAGGTIDLNGFNGTTGSLTGAGTVTNGGGAAITLTTGANNASTTFSGAIQNGVNAIALIKNGTGNFELSGTNTYTGATTVNAGTLSVNGSTATSLLTTINTGATLGGNGTVGNTTINGGALAPGNSIGTLTVAGNLTFTAASAYMVQVSPSAADRTNVSGVATLGGATVNAAFDPGSYVSKQYTIINATGGVSGTFGALVNSNLPTNFSSNLSYDASNVFLNLTMAGPSSSLNVNQTNVSNALVNFFNRTGGIPAVFATLSPAGLTQVSGESATGSQQTTFDAMNMFMGVLTDPFVDGRGDPRTPGAIPFANDSADALAYAANGRKRTGSEREAYGMVTKAPPMAAVYDPRWSVWAAGFGGSQTTDGNAAVGSNTATSRIYGTAVGADYWFSPQTIAGFALAGGGSNFSVNNLGSGRSDLFQAGAFIKHTVGPAYILGALAYGWQDVTTDRTVTVAGIDQLRARFNANAYSGRVEAGYRYLTPWMGVGITPYAAGQFTTFDLPAYAETVVSGLNTFALSYAGKSVTASRSELGLRSDKSWVVNDGLFTLRGRAAWAHDYNTDRSIGATFQTLPGASFVVNGATPARDAALTTASAEMKWRNGISIAGTFEGEFSQLTRSYAGKGVVRYTW